jgi:hypothetical protein
VAYWVLGLCNGLTQISMGFFSALVSTAEVHKRAADGWDFFANETIKDIHLQFFLFSWAKNEGHLSQNDKLKAINIPFFGDCDMISYITFHQNLLDAFFNSGVVVGGGITQMMRHLGVRRQKGISHKW